MKKQPLERMANLPKKKPNIISVPFNKGLHIIKCNSILFLQSQSSYTMIFQEGKKEIVSSHTLKSFESQLPKEQFLRIHRSYIVNLNRVETIINSPFSVVVGKHTIPISKQLKVSLKEYFS